MKTTRNFAQLLGIVALVVVGSQFLARGQQPRDEPLASSCSIAIVDIALIFKESERFRLQMEEMKSDVADAEKLLREDRDVIEQLLQELAVAEDPIVKNRLQAHVAEKNALLQAKVNTQKQEFMQREAKIYASNYREIERHIQDYAEQHDIRLVLRFNRIGIPDDENREQTLAAVNRAVVYHRDLDITDAVVKLVDSPQQDS